MRLKKMSALILAAAMALAVSSTASGAAGNRAEVKDVCKGASVEFDSANPEIMHVSYADASLVPGNQYLILMVRQTGGSWKVEEDTLLYADQKAATSSGDAAEVSFDVYPLSVENSVILLAGLPDGMLKLASVSVSGSPGSGGSSGSGGSHGGSSGSSGSHGGSSSEGETPGGSTPPEPGGTWKNPFSDAPADWYQGALRYVVEHGLMKGTSETEFSPSVTTTRAMVMAILARQSGADTGTSDPWYQAALDWAVANGISDGTNPDAEITREQLAAMLWRHAGRPAFSRDTVSGFPDCADISDWAEDGMAWAADTGIVSGTDAGTIVPKGIATRAETAVMIQRYLELAGGADA